MRAVADANNCRLLLPVAGADARHLAIGLGNQHGFAGGVINRAGLRTGQVPARPAGQSVDDFKLDRFAHSQVGSRRGHVQVGAIFNAATWSNGHGQGEDCGHESQRRTHLPSARVTLVNAKRNHRLQARSARQLVAGSCSSTVWPGRTADDGWSLVRSFWVPTESWHSRASPMKIVASTSPRRMLSALGSASTSMLMSSGRMTTMTLSPAATFSGRRQRNLPLAVFTSPTPAAQGASTRPSRKFVRPMKWATNFSRGA